MPFFAEANLYLDDSSIINSTVSNCIITKNNITQSTIDMLSSSGNLSCITNVADPINLQDAATKYYVDSKIIVKNVDIIGVLPSLILDDLSGSFTIHITNLVLNGPTAIFMITKNGSQFQPQIARIVASPGFSTFTYLDLSWIPGEGVKIFKSDINYDGSYHLKII